VIHSTLLNCAECHCRCCSCYCHDRYHSRIPHSFLSVLHPLLPPPVFLLCEGLNVIHLYDICHFIVRATTGSIWNTVIQNFLACVTEHGIICRNKNIGFCFHFEHFSLLPCVVSANNHDFKFVMVHLNMSMAVLCLIFCVFFRPLCSMYVRMRCTSFQLFYCQALNRSIFHIHHIVWRGLWRTQHCVLTQLTLLSRDMDCYRFVCFLLLFFPFLVSVDMERVN
jgi:hypothetical protein